MAAVFLLDTCLPFLSWYIFKLKWNGTQIPVKDHHATQMNRSHLFLFESPYCWMFTGRLSCGFNQSGCNFINETALHSFEGGYSGRHSVIVLCNVCVHVCVYAGCRVRLAIRLKAVLLLAAVLASWQQIKSRAGAVYVTWGRASGAFQQLACLSLWRDSPLSACVSVCLPMCLSVWLMLSVSKTSSCLSVALSVCLALFLYIPSAVCSTFSTGGVVRESTRFFSPFFQDLETINT